MNATQSLLDRIDEELVADPEPTPSLGARDYVKRQIPMETQPPHMRTNITTPFISQSIASITGLKHEAVVSGPAELRKVATDIQDRARYPWAMRQDVSRHIIG